MTKLTNLSLRMLNRAVKMGSQGMHTLDPDERSECERLRDAGKLEFKNGRRASGPLQFFVITGAGLTAFGSAA